MTTSERVAQARQQAMLNTYMSYIIIGSILAVIIYCVVVAGLWKMFEKSGEKGWKALIPFYNMYILYRIFWKPVWFWTFCGGLLFIMIFGNWKFNNTMATVFAFIILAVVVYMFVLKIIIAYKICSAYGKNIWYVLGFVFADFVFIPILGFGQSKCSVKAVIKPAKFKIVRVDKKDENKAAEDDDKDASAEKVAKEEKPKKRIIKKEDTDMFEVPKSNKPNSLNRRKAASKPTTKKASDASSAKKSSSKSTKKATTKKTASKPKARTTKSSTAKKKTSASKASTSKTKAKKATKPTARKKTTAKKTTKSGKSSIKVESPIDFE